MDRIDKFLDELEKTFAYIREREGGDSVCGLCEYDGAYIGESGDWCNECPGFNKDDCFKLSDEIRKKWKAQLSQEGTTKDTTSDTISRQAAIDAIVNCTNCGDEKTLRAYVAKHNLDNGWTGGILEAIDAIEDLPSVQPEQRWIPCSERLPEEEIDVLVTRKFLGCKDSGHGWNNHMTPKTYVEVAQYFCGEWEALSDEYKIARNRHTNPIAWMPLPEPYKGEINK